MRAKHGLGKDLFKGAIAGAVATWVMGKVTGTMYEREDRWARRQEDNAREGKTAYDRPDNLVLACRVCNAAKADTPLVAFLMQKRARGVYLLHYGDHLSEPLKELARQASERPMLPKD